MDDSDTAAPGTIDSTTLGIINRLGRLEGLLVGLQASITQSQTQMSTHVARVERLEQRQVELEARVVTRDDLQQLTNKVDAMAVLVGKGQGGAGVFRDVVTVLIATVAATAAVIGVMRGLPDDAVGPAMPHTHNPAPR